MIFKSLNFTLQWTYLTVTSTSLARASGSTVSIRRTGGATWKAVPIPTGAIPTGTIPTRIIPTSTIPTVPIPTRHYP